MNGPQALTWYIAASTAVFNDAFEVRFIEAYGRLTVDDKSKRKLKEMVVA
jgi:hypothetical protein